MTTPTVHTVAESEPTSSEATVEPSEALGAADPAVEASQPKVRAPWRLRRPEGPVFFIAASVSLLALLFLGFGAYLFAFSGLQEQHSQAALYRTLSGELGSGTAPVGPTADGAPVAIVDIPAIGLHQAVVVEGTTGEDLARGPGHLRDTVLPGEPGVAVIFGRRATFGAPFGKLPELRIGDRISVTTGQGKFIYTVNAYGSGAHPIEDTDPARLVLVTADSTWIPEQAIYVGARLDVEPAPAPPRSSQYLAMDKPLATDAAALLAVQLWSLALLVAGLVATVGAQLWHRSGTYLAMAPVLLALLWCVYENLATILPNVY
jgi:sortase A